MMQHLPTRLDSIDPSHPPRIETRDQLINALRATAELEHAVMCQYLFAAFSMKHHPSEGGVTSVQLERMREWKTTLHLVARQEMEHLGIVCNLLTAIGGTAQFVISEFPHRPPICPSIDCLSLEPFSTTSIGRFMEIERGHAVTGENDGETTIGDAYREIRRGFERLHKSNVQLFIGPADRQVVNSTIDLRPGLYDMQLRAVHDIESALIAIDQIMESSDAPPEANPNSHYMRFKRVHDEMRTVHRKDRAFEPARRVGVNPVTRPPSDNRSGVTTVDHHVSRKAALLFSAAYETMLLMLARFYSPTDESTAERSGLKRAVFFPMMTMVLRPLGEMLTQMPAHVGCTEIYAGPTFEIRTHVGLPPRREIAWIRIYERLERLAASSTDLVGALEGEKQPWAQSLRTRATFLSENLKLLASNFGNYMNVNELQRRYLLERVLGSH